MALGPVFVITPMIGWSWPALFPLAVAVAAGYGYKKLTGTGEKDWLRGRVTKEMENLRLVSVPIDEMVQDAIGESVARDERLIFEKDDTRLIFRRDPRGKFFIDVLGPRARTEQSLRNEALTFARELVQQFVYDRVMRELQERGLNVVNESVEADNGDIMLELRRWT